MFVRATIASAALAVAFSYYQAVDVPHLEARKLLHDSILNGSAPSPYRYRLLVPWLAEALRRTLELLMQDRRAFLASYALYDGVSVCFLFASLFAWFREWFDARSALLGVLFVAAVLPISFTEHHFQPWSILEAGLFAAGLLALHRRRFALFGLLVLLAALNKETGLILPGAFLVLAIRAGAERRRWILLAALFMCLWIAVTAGLHILRGSAAFVIPATDRMSANLSRHGIMLTIENGVLFLGAFWVFAWKGWRRAPSFLKSSALVVPPYLAVVALWGIWYEVRLLLPLYAIVVPLALSAVSEASDAPWPQAP